MWEEGGRMEARVSICCSHENGLFLFQVILPVKKRLREDLVVDLK